MSGLVGVDLHATGGSLPAKKSTRGRWITLAIWQTTVLREDIRIAPSLFLQRDCGVQYDLLKSMILEEESPKRC